MRNSVLSVFDAKLAHESHSRMGQSFAEYIVHQALQRLTGRIRCKYSTNSTFLETLDQNKCDAGDWIRCD